MDASGKGCKMPWHVVVWSVGLALKLVEDSMAGLSGSGNLVEVTQALRRQCRPVVSQGRNQQVYCPESLLVGSRSADEALQTQETIHVNSLTRSLSSSFETPGLNS